MLEHTKLTPSLYSLYAHFHVIDAYDFVVEPVEQQNQRQQDRTKRSGKAPIKRAGNVIGNSVRDKSILLVNSKS